MIHWSQHRAAINAAGAASAGALVYGLVRRGRHRLPIVVGLAGLAGAAAATYAANHEDKELVRNPEVMNGHFITEGRASALAGLEDVAYLRALMGVPQHQPERGRRHGHHLR